MVELRPETGKREAPPARYRRAERSRLPLIVALLVLLLAGGLLLLWPKEQEPKEPETFLFGGQELTALEGMPRSPYSPEGFSLDERGRVSYEGAEKRGRMGVDVSVYQKEIDWQAAAADGVEFAILRLGYRGYSEGGLFPDKYFEQNLQGALDAGLEVGIYFFSQAITPEEAEEEAAYILETLAGRPLTYPVAFDWEPITPGKDARTDNLDGETLTRCAAAFCKKIEEAGYTPAVYFNQSMGYFLYDLRELTDWCLWLAEYDTQPDFYYHFDLWQYTHTGQVNGIEGDVDLDLDLR